MDCSGHLGICPTPEQLGKHQVISDGMPYDHKKAMTCRHCINLMWAWRWELCDKYGWDQWPDSLDNGYEKRLR